MEIKQKGYGSHPLRNKGNDINEGNEGILQSSTSAVISVSEGREKNRIKIDNKKSLKVHHLMNEKYVPGAPQEVKDWLALRRSYFKVRDSAKKTETLVSEIESKLPYFWSAQMKSQIQDDMKASEDLNTPLEESRENKDLPSDLTPLQSFEYKLEHMKDFGPEAILSDAIGARHCRFLELAFRAGVDLNIPLDKLGRTALHLASFRGDIKKVEKLISFGASPRVQDSRLDSPLHLSLKILPEAFKVERICKHLLLNGADVHCRNRFEQTALHQACILGDLRIIDPLLQAGSDVYALDSHGKLPLQYCKRQQEAVYIFSCHERPGWKRSRHQLMWAHLLSREFVSHVFKY